MKSWKSWNNWSAWKSRSGLLIVICVGLGVGIVSSRQVRASVSPWRILSDSDRPLAYVSEGCGACLEFVESLHRQQTPEVLAISLGEPGTEFEKQLCGQALAAVDDAFRWIPYPVPDELACRWMREDAERFWREHYTWVPAFSVEGHPLSEDEGEAIRARVVGG